MVLRWFVWTLGITIGVVAVARGLDVPDVAILAVFVPSGTAVVLSPRRRELVGERPSGRVFFASLVAIPALAILAELVADGVRIDVTLASLIPVTLIALGEEFGWRGFAYPRLRADHGPLVGAVAVGVMWAVWHIPGALIGVGVAEGASVSLFFGWVLAVSIFIAGVMERTYRSTLIAIAVHMGANLSFAWMAVTPTAYGSSIPLSVLAAVTGATGIALLARPPRQSGAPGSARAERLGR